MGAAPPHPPFGFYGVGGGAPSRCCRLAVLVLAASGLKRRPEPLLLSATATKKGAYAPKPRIIRPIAASAPIITIATFLICYGFCVQNYAYLFRCDNPLS